MPPAIQIEQLTKDFAIGFWRRQSRRVLDGLTLHVARGEIFGFPGPNGAGKTTTLKLLIGLLFRTSGRAWVLGRPAGEVELRRRVGFLPEQPCFYDYLTAEELLEYFAGLVGETGRLATSWAPLAARGWLPRDPPRDPAGVPYALDPITGLATVSERSPYYPLPIDTALSPLPRSPS